MPVNFPSPFRAVRPFLRPSRGGGKGEAPGDGGPGRIRTANRRSRNPVRYPIAPRAHSGLGPFLMGGGRFQRSHSDRFRQSGMAGSSAPAASLAWVATPASLPRASPQWGERHRGAAIGEDSNPGGFGFAEACPPLPPARFRHSGKARGGALAATLASPHRGRGDEVTTAQSVSLALSSSPVSSARVRR